MAQLKTIEVLGEHCPQLFCRIMGLFAQQNLIPAQMEAKSSTHAIRLSLSVDTIDDQRLRIITEKIRALVNVETVALIE